MTKPKPDTYHRLFFQACLIFLGFVTLYIIRAYVGLFFLAYIITVIFNPLYVWLVRRFKHPGLSALTATLVLLTGVLIPLILVVTLSIGQALNLINHLPAFIIANNQLVTALLDYANQLGSHAVIQINELFVSPPSDLAGLLQTLITVVTNILVKNILPLVNYSIQAVTQTVFFFVFVVYLFPYRRQIVTALKSVSPLAAKDHDYFISRFEAITAGTVKSMLIIGFIQGFLGGLMLSFLSFPAPAFWGLLMAIASLVPLGAGIVWVPISISLLVSGQWLPALILFAWGAFVISTVDNIIRAKLLASGQAQLPEIITLLSVLGGINTFGFWGVLYGPTIAGMFYVAFTFYQKKRLA